MATRSSVRAAATPGWHTEAEYVEALETAQAEADAEAAEVETTSGRPAIASLRSSVGGQNTVHAAVEAGYRQKHDDTPAEAHRLALGRLLSPGRRRT